MRALSREHQLSSKGDGSWAVLRTAPVMAASRRTVVRMDLTLSLIGYSGTYRAAVTMPAPGGALHLKMRRPGVTRPQPRYGAQSLVQVRGS
jgi:hypothetical protein